MAAEPHDAHGAADAASSGLPQFDFATWPGQIFWLLIAFGLLYLVLSRALLPRVAATLEARRDKIADDLDHAARLKRQAEEAERAYAKALADARAKANAIAAETREAMNAKIAEKTAEAEAKLAARAAQAETRIQAASDAALSEVRKIAAGAAASIVEKLSGRAPEAGDVIAALDRVQGRGG